MSRRPTKAWIASGSGDGAITKARAGFESAAGTRAATVATVGTGSTSATIGLGSATLPEEAATKGKRVE